MKVSAKMGNVMKVVNVGLMVATMAGLAGAGRAAVPSSGRIWLEGQSTLHAYKTEATAFEVSLDADGSGSAAQLLQQHAIRGAKLVLPVVHLRSGESKLDSNLRNALNVRANPDIVFKAETIEASPEEGRPFPVKLTGTLKVAGVERPETIDAQGTLENGALHLTGAKALRMTDFKVDPPVMMLGTIRCTDDITIKFDLLLK